MPGEPESLGEVARLLKSMNESFERRFDSLESRLDKLVSAEVHGLHVSHTDRRIQELSEALANERAARVQDLAREVAEREKAVTHVTMRLDRTGTWVRAIGISMLIPVALFIMNFMLASGGP